MQILITWRAANLSPEEAAYRWMGALKLWQARYQTLLPSTPLRLWSMSAGMLFCGQIGVPSLFRDWEQWHEDDAWGVAWNGIAHNLCDLLPAASSLSISQRFLQMNAMRGSALLQELEGRFIVAVLDKRRQRLDISTPALGMAPCFRTEGKYGLAVGTRIAPLLDLVGRPIVPNRSGMLQVFAMDWCLNNETTFEGVEQVPAGTTISFDMPHARFQQEPHSRPETLLDYSRRLRQDDYLAIGSEIMNTAMIQQLRHASAPLFDLTGGLDSRTIVATATAVGASPECDVSGLPESRELRLAAQVADALSLQLHQIHLDPQCAEGLDETARCWGMWTEGMIPAHISFAQSFMSVSPALRPFYEQYRHIFNGAGGETGRSMFYNTEMLARHFSPEQIVAKLFEHALKRFRHHYFVSAQLSGVRDAIASTIQQGHALGLQESQLIDFFYWQQRAGRWAGYMADMQQIGRYVFTPLCQQPLFAVFLAMTLPEHLSSAWHISHLRRSRPELLAIPLMKSPLFSGARKRLWERSPAMFSLLWHLKTAIWPPQHSGLPAHDREKLGTYFHAFLERLLFHKQAYWPEIVPYASGRIAWEHFVNGLEAKPLWNMVTIEIWAHTFLGT